MDGRVSGERKIARTREGSLGTVVADRAQRLGELMADPDQARAKRVSEAMLKMVKFDIAELEAAGRG